MGAKLPYQAKLLLLRALTPIHAGVGRGASEHVDLPVQRDEFGFPCIWASSLKGAVRGCLRRLISALNGELRERFGKCLEVALGPPPGRAHEGSAAISFLDARLLFMPARSLRGVWTYITCPHLVRYLSTYLEAIGRRDLSEALSKSVGELRWPVASRDDILLSPSRASGARRLEGGGLAVINEVDVEVRHLDKSLVAKVFGRVLPRELMSLLERRGLLILGDDEALELVNRSMLVQYRVRLSRAKTVEEGPWTEEYLPQEAILTSAAICTPVRRGSDCSDPCAWLEEALERLDNVLWLGGKETIGKGLLKLYVTAPPGERP